MSLLRSEDGSIPAVQGGGGSAGTETAAACYDRGITALLAKMLSK